MNVFEEAPLFKDGPEGIPQPFTGQEEGFLGGLCYSRYNYQENPSNETPASFTIM